MLAFGLETLYSPVVRIAAEALVSTQSICSDNAARFNRFGDEAVQAGSGQIGDARQTDAADASSVFLGRHYDYGLVCRPSPNNPFFFAAPVSVVYLDCSPQSIAAGANHSPAKFVQPRPRGQVAAKAKHLLETHRACAVLLTGDMPNRSEPHPQRLSRILKNSPGRHRPLMPARPTDQAAPRSRPASAAAATGTNKAVRPSELEQVAPTGILSRKSVLKLQNRSRVILHTRINYLLC